MGFPEFQEALDAVWGSITQDTQKSVDTLHWQQQQHNSGSQLQATFDENLRRARAAFLQCFRNHAVVVDKEVARIKNDISSSFEEMYGEKITILRNKTAEDASMVSKYKEEVS